MLSSRPEVPGFKRLPSEKLRNEVDPSDTTDWEAKPPLGFVIVLLSAFHVLCCGLLPLLLFSGVSVATLFPSWPVAAGMLALIGVGGVVRYITKGWAGCANSEALPAEVPSNQGGLHTLKTGD